MYTVANLISVLEQMAPNYLAESWDNVGLILGSRQQPVDTVLCALDLNEEVLEEAIRLGSHCIVTHHPFIFSPMKRLDLDTPKGRMIERLIKHDIAVYAMHTNLDIVAGGINDVLCERLGITSVKMLHRTHREALVKLCVYVPRSHFEAVRTVMVDQNDYRIGNYCGCTFKSEGEGTFIPLEGSNPYLGESLTLEKVEEVKIECMLKQSQVQAMISEIKKVHPYEEIAYDVFELKHMTVDGGLGRYGNIPKCTVEVFARRLKELLNIPTIRIVGDLDRTIEKVAICSGSGSSYIQDAVQVADIYITGDVKFHEAQEALDRGLCVVDVGHYASENIMMPVVADRLEKAMEGIKVISSQVKGEVFQTI